MSWCLSHHDALIESCIGDVYQCGLDMCATRHCHMHTWLCSAQLLASANDVGGRCLHLVASQTQECESLMRIVRELTENRSKLACARSNLAERLAEVQHEYMRLMRVADLSRVVSKENVAKTAKVTRSLQQVRSTMCFKTAQPSTAEEMIVTCMNITITDCIWQ